MIISMYKQKNPQAKLKQRDEQVKFDRKFWGTNSKKNQKPKPWNDDFLRGTLFLMNTMTSYFTGIKSERMHWSGSNEVDYISEQSDKVWC